ncbi:unnamed protein product, partial [Prorocentrum cordatum]
MAQVPAPLRGELEVEIDVGSNVGPGGLREQLDARARAARDGAASSGLACSRAAMPSRGNQAGRHGCASQRPASSPVAPRARGGVSSASSCWAAPAGQGPRDAAGGYAEGGVEAFGSADADSRRGAEAVGGPQLEDSPAPREGPTGLEAGPRGVGAGHGAEDGNADPGQADLDPCGEGANARAGGDGALWERPRRGARARPQPASRRGA